MQSLTSTPYVDFYRPGPAGSHVIHARIDHHHGHVAVTVAHSDALNRTFRTPAEADTYLAYLAQQVNEGHTLWQIEQAAGVYTNVTAVFDELAQQVLADTAQPATLDTFRQAHRPVRNTRTRAYLKPPTAPMLRLMRQHTGGLVTTDGRANWRSLASIADKGYGEAIYRPDTYIVDAVRLNAAGLALVESEVKAA